MAGPKVRGPVAYDGESTYGLQVRRAALRRQLELEYRQYQEELREQGKALHFQRI